MSTEQENGSSSRSEGGKAGNGGHRQGMVERWNNGIMEYWKDRCMQGMMELWKIGMNDGMVEE